MIKRIVTNGCSWMWGMGVNSLESKHPDGGRLTDRVSARLAKKYDARDINLSIPGSSNDRILRTTTEWFMQNQDEDHSETFVLIGLSQMMRGEVWFNPEIKLGSGSWLRTISQDYYDKKWKCFNQYVDLRDVYFTSNRSDYERTLRNIINMVAICEYYGAKYLITDALANIRHWALNGYIDDRTPDGTAINPESFNLPKYKQHDYEYGHYGNHSEEQARDSRNGLIYHDEKETGIDVHHDYKRSLEKLIEPNPNIYVETTFDQICGGANYTQRAKKPYFKVPNGWKTYKEDMDLSLYAYGRDNAHGNHIREKGHPGNEGHRVWYEHLVNYIEKNDIL